MSKIFRTVSLAAQQTTVPFRVANFLPVSMSTRNPALEKKDNSRMSAVSCGTA